MTRKILFLGAIVSLSVALGALGACNTVEGMGQDVEHAGQKIQDAF